MRSGLAGARPAPVDVGFVGECISLGRRAGIFQVARRDDTATGLHLGGRPGARLKELICRGTVWQLANEGRHPGAPAWWFKDDRRRQQLAELRAAEERSGAPGR